MQALAKAQGRPDKLQSARGVNLVREGLELFTAFKSFKNSCLEDEIGFSQSMLCIQSKHNACGGCLAVNDQMTLILID